MPWKSGDCHSVTTPVSVGLVNVVATYAHSPGPAGLTSVATALAAMAAHSSSRDRRPAVRAASRATTAMPSPMMNPACRLAHTRNSGGSTSRTRVEPLRQRITT